MQKKNIILINSFIGGHHLLYLKKITEIIKSFNQNVIIFTPNSKEFKKNLKNSTLVYEYNMLPKKKYKIKFLSSFFNKMKQWKYLNEAIKGTCSNLNLKPDLVFFCWFDSYWLNIRMSYLILNFIFKYKWIGLFFHPSFIRKNTNYKNKIGTNPYSIFLNKNCQGIAILDEKIKEIFKSKIKKNVYLFPDFTDTSLLKKDNKLLEEIKEKAKNRKIVSLLGSIDKRKNLILFLKCAKKLISKNLFFLIIGKFHENSFTKKELLEIDLIINELKDKNCFIHLKRIEDENVFNSIINISSVLFIPYLKFYHSSNLITKAAAFKIPVIVSKGYLMEERVKKFNLGYVINPNSEEECINTFLNIEKYNFKNAKFNEYLKFHDISNLNEKFNEILNNIE